MRGILAYALVFLILLNIGGYHALFLGIQINSTNQLIKKLDANAFNPDETLLVKVPITVPYASDSKDFESKWNL
jgi:hypothetical protein